MQAPTPSGWEAGAARPRAVRATLVVLGLLALGYALAHSSRDVAGTRIARASGGEPVRRTEFLGISNWYLHFELGSVVVFVAVWSSAVLRSRRRGKPTPTLILMAVTTALTVLDPIMNWAPYAAYDPRMFHFDVDWPWFDLAPTVEPWAVIIGYGYFFLIPAWFTLAVHRWLAARVAREPSSRWSVVNRRPRLTVLVFAVPICILWDGLLEALFVRFGFYTYTQVVPWGSIFTGRPWQFPLIWEAVLFGLTLAPAAPLMWADDKGRTWGETVALRMRVCRGRPHIGAFAVMFALMSAVYLGYGGCFGAIRASGLATAVAAPWRYPEAAVFDPQGYFERAGGAGPFYPGTWAGWERRAG